MGSRQTGDKVTDSPHPPPLSCAPFCPRVRYPALLLSPPYLINLSQCVVERGREDTQGPSRTLLTQLTQLWFGVICPFLLILQTPKI